MDINDQITDLNLRDIERRKAIEAHEEILFGDGKKVVGVITRMSVMEWVMVGNFIATLVLVVIGFLILSRLP